MARITPEYLKGQHPFLEAILNGEFDGVMMENIEHAVAIRKKSMFRKGTKVKLVQTGNIEIEGKTGEVIKVGPKRIAVGIGKATTDQWGTTYEDGSYNIPPRMLEVVA